MIIHDVEQNTPEWFALRCGIPTASEFHRIVTSTGTRSKQLEDYAAQLAAEAYAGVALERWNGNAATERGHELELEAVTAYAFVRGVTPRRVGFVSNDFAGASPDALIADDGLLEVKCQMAKGHVQTLDYIRKNGKAPPDYIAQAHGQMLICDRRWVDLMFYHPSLPEAIVRIHRMEQFDLALLQNLAHVVDERNRLLETIKGYA